MLEESATPAETPKTEAKATGEGATGDAKDAAPAEEPIPTATLPTTDEEKLADAKDGEVFPHFPKKPETAAGFKPLFDVKGAGIYKAGKMADFSAEKYDKIEKEVDEAAKKAAAEAKKSGEGGDGVETVKASSWFFGVDRMYVQSLIVMFTVFMIGF